MTIPFHLQQLAGQAQALERAQRVPEAIAAYHQLLSQYPGLPDCWYNYGLLLRRAGRFHDALNAYGQALKHDAQGPEEIRLNRAVIYSDDLQQPDEAVRELNEALAINPNYAPALMNLANAHEDLSDRDAARAVYERLLAMAPNDADALSRLSELDKASGTDDPMIARIKTALAAHASNPMGRAALNFALGRLYDSCSAYDEAFAAYQAANAASAEGAGPGRMLYDRAAEERFTRDWMTTFPAPPAFEPRPPSKPQPIFILGMFRSGSTLCERILAGHSQITAGGEFDIIPRLMRGLGGPAGVANAPEDQIKTVAQSYLRQLASVFPDAVHITDKRPDNFRAVGLIKRMFPDAKIIRTRRDALDNCLSVHFLHLDHAMGYALNLENTAHQLLQERVLMEHWAKVWPDDVLTVDYEAVIADPRPQVERLLAFLGLDWDDKCLEFHTRRETVKTASRWQVREPLHDRSVARWRNYERHLDGVRAYLEQVGLTKEA